MGTQTRKANARDKLKQTKNKCIRRVKVMSRNKNVVPEARAALDKFKMEAASEVGVNLKQGYNGDLTSKEAGSVGGQMVKNMIKSYEQNMK
jgi:small acid-soluble spore protein D (minor alpha/beta-type SASP)